MKDLLATKALISILLFFTLLLVSERSLSDENNSSVQSQLKTYASLLHNVIYDWNYPSEISNEDIFSNLEKSQIQNDDSEISVIFRHLMALSTTDNTDSPRIPVYIKQPLLNKYWVGLKSMSPEIYAYTYAYYIYIKASNTFNGSTQRTAITIPAMLRLKDEMLRTGNKQAVATVSMWLAMEYSESSPLRAINELQYALPHLPIKSKLRPLETELDKITALAWLTSSYLELNVPSLALKYAQTLVNLKTQNETVSAWDFILPIRASNCLGEFMKSLDFIKEAKSVTDEDNKIQQLILYALELSTLNKINTKDNLERIKELSLALTNLQLEKIPPRLIDIQPYSYALYQALVGSDYEFSKAISEFIKVTEYQKKLLPFPRDASLNALTTLQELYRARGDLENAFAYQKKFELELVKFNADQFSYNEELEKASMSEDIELAKFRQQELEDLRNERMGLNQDNGKLQSTVFLLFTAILSILAIWLWLYKRRNDTQIKYDELTGTLTRSAMLKSLTVALKKDRSSCMALVNIDHFQRINDTYGYRVGEEVVSVLGKTIQKRIRKTDKFCRFGNEEFLIYFSNSNEDEVKRILDELNNLLAKQKWWKNTEQSFTTSFSSGVVTLNGENNLDYVLKYCHKLLEGAKNKGNAVAMTQSTSPV